MGERSEDTCLMWMNDLKMAVEVNDPKTVVHTRHGRAHMHRPEHATVPPTSCLSTTDRHLRPRVFGSRHSAGGLDRGGPAGVQRRGL